MVGRFIIHNFRGIGPIPTRSAFAGRLQGTPKGDFRRFQMFYATNRADNKDTFDARGSEIGDTILTGTYDVLISPYLIIEPFVWFDKVLVKWAGRQELPKEKFRSKLRETVQSSPNKSLLVIVWGFRDWFQSAALKTAYTAFVLDLDRVSFQARIAEVQKNVFGAEAWKKHFGVEVEQCALPPEFYEFWFANENWKKHFWPILSPQTVKPISLDDFKRLKSNTVKQYNFKTIGKLAKKPLETYIFNKIDKKAKNQSSFIGLYHVMSYLQGSFLLQNRKNILYE